ncbi:PAS domain-containing sensor histidine kinase [Spirosoma gilvum]
MATSPLADDITIYRALLDSIDEGFHISELLYDPTGQPIDWRYLEVNQVFERQTGLLNVVGKLGSEVAPNTESYWFQTYDQVLQTGQSLRFENYNQATGRWYSAYAARIGPEGSHLFAVVFDDITERKQTEEALRVSQERQAFLLQLSDAIRPLTDAVELQQTSMRLVAHQLDVMQATYFEVAPDQDTFNLTARYERDAVPIPAQMRLSDFSPTLAADYRTGRTLLVQDTEAEAQREAYRAIGVRAWAAVPLVKGGQLMAIVGVHTKTPRHWTSTDVQLLEEVAQRTWAAVEKAKAEEALHQSEERFRLLVTASSDSLYQMSADWSQMLNLKGMNFLTNTNQASAHWLMGYIPDEDQSEVQRAIQQAIETKQMFEQEHRVIQADGTVGWTLSRAIPVLDKQGEFCYWFGAASDITPRKHMEEHLRQTDRRKDEFLAMLAHELRNPLTPVRTGLQVLSLTDSDDPTLNSLLPIMNRQMDHVMRLVDDLLDVSRISRGKIDLQKEPLDLTSVVDQAAQAIRPLYEQAGRLLHVALPTSPLPLNGDPTRLHQVVTNLLTNGLRYTHENRNGEPGQVWLSLEEIGFEAVLQVRDNGIGLAADQLQAIFGLFVQVDTSLARSNSGLGLGLTLVQQLIEMHGGRIEAFSPGLDQGSEFVIHLPVFQA